MKKYIYQKREFYLGIFQIVLACIILMAPAEIEKSYCVTAETYREVATFQSNYISNMIIAKTISVVCAIKFLYRGVEKMAIAISNP